MIIRNPYGFVARHFKIINILLMIPMLYLAFKLSDTSNFFNSYISSGYSTPETNFADTYINGLMYFITFILLISNIIIYVILTSKKKNGIIYLINILYCIILFVAMTLFHSAMSSIETSDLDATFANFVRDCSLISYFPMYILMILHATKAVGFNFRTMSFDNNSDLKIKEEDEEDIEIKVGSGNNSLKKNLVHLIRELKYYVLENKFVFMCIGAVLLIFISYNLYMDFQVYNKSISIRQAFNLDDFTLSLKESYITDVDYRGNTIEEDKYYLAIRIGIQNNSLEDSSISDSNFRIYIGNEVLYPSYDKSSRFLDIGEVYQGETIRSTEAHDYVFVYELTKKQLKSSYQMRILNGLTEKNGSLIKKYRKITVRPQNITKTENLGTLKPNQEVSLKKTTIGDTKYMLKNIELVTSYPYQYEVCKTSDNCNKVNDTIVAKAGKALLVIEDDITLDETTPYFKYVSKDFYVDFTYLAYKYAISSGNDAGNDKYKTINLTNITPSTLKGKKVYEVPSSILSANKINLVIRIRNKYITTEIK